MEASGPARLRPFAPHDLAGVYRVCADVDARGGDERQRLLAPELAGHVFAGPYLLADPGLGWVVADELGIAGYVVGTTDAAEFERWREDHWYPAIREQYRAVIGGEGYDDGRYLRFLHAPPRSPETFPTWYPAEMHIKLDPRAAGRGWGRKLIETLVAELRERRVAGIHLIVASQNENALGFYARLGFRPLSHGTGSVTMVRDLL